MKMLRFSALRTGRLYTPTQEISQFLNPRAIVRSEELGQSKIWVTPLGIEPAL